MGDVGFYGESDNLSESSSIPAGGHAATQTGDQRRDGPFVDITQLGPWDIGPYSGVGEQENPDNEWSITVTLTYRSVHRVEPRGTGDRDGGRGTDPAEEEVVPIELEGEGV